MKHTVAMAALLAGLASAGGAMAQTEINVLRVTVNEEQEAYYEQIAEAFEAEHEGVNVTFEYIANEAYKSKLPTLLQSNARPDIFYSWGGQTLVEQAEAGFLQPISSMLSESFVETIPEAGLTAYSVDGTLYGLPLYATEVIFWTNKALTDQAGIDLDAIKTWEDFLGAVQTLKDADITPIVVGGQDKWPVHFYWSYLALREGGKDIISQAMAGEDGGFENEAFVAAGEDFQELVALEPFQPGYMGTTYETASGMFADGAGAFHLMGDWDYLPMRERSTSGEGLPDDQLAIVNFPAISDPVAEGGDAATLGGINGWAVTNSAEPEAVEFLAYMLSAENQREGARQQLFIPIVKGTGDALDNPFYAKVSKDIEDSSYHQIFLDQFLGASVGATVNDISADLAQDAITPEEAAAQVQEAWSFR
ncbi:carbohydrate ABC transporter substrate-binding protein, CUT1 family [Pseudooceanicola antarcticus]|uniref:ABC transporter substrate-binding protein n=1 Tax=Pseudooceanicola antarcticus TaxID=1247613 RepID=A0A285J6B8_9RHOB|nr:extracellular solute-binding protein [Pseudooceanicola antarcticus]PJE26918.1 ABC transporter substrate-binding protein [Pseudooceanicola antarcticus]SNY55768.1 carbohydrate ABC transporter substrate-binding protein, CUT1 family [Pseudooceanicola antarcticus]